MRNALTQALVAGPGQLARPRPAAQAVGPPSPLPPATRFGSLNPSIVTGNKFSGGVNPGTMNLVHPDTPQTFQAPTYTSPTTSGGIHPLAPIIAALTGVGAAPPGGGGLPGNTGAAQPAPAYHPIPGAQQVTSYNFANPARQQSTTTGGFYEGALSAPQTSPTYKTLSSILAQAGKTGIKQPGIPF